MFQTVLKSRKFWAAVIGVVYSFLAVADPLLAPAIYIGERFGIMPEIYIADNQLSGALFTNDEVRIKARHFLSVFVADYRPLYKANAVNE